MSRPLIRLVLLGAPASGKGTLAKHIIQKHNIVHVSPGDILRLHIVEDTAMGREIRTFVKRGHLVPDHVVLQCVLQRVGELDQECQSWILDGFPRTLMQAMRLHELVPTMDAVCNVIVPDAVIMERATNRWTHLPSGRIYNKNFNEPKVLWKDDVTGEDLVQRPDDRPNVVQQRLRVYNETIAPILDFYRSQCITILQLDGATTDDNLKRVDSFVKEKKTGSGNSN